MIGFGMGVAAFMDGPFDLVIFPLSDAMSGPKSFKARLASSTVMGQFAISRCVSRSSNVFCEGRPSLIYRRQADSAPSTWPRVYLVRLSATVWTKEYVLTDSLLGLQVLAS